jgi:7-keto-8-aminopelargonate synthetase-like enzyme
LPVVTFRNRDPGSLAENAAKFPRVLALADAISPATGAIAPVSDYLPVLEDREHAVLLLDDAHGFGVLGTHGRGLFEELGLWPHVNGGPPVNGVELAVCGTLAKALGGYGGIIPGTTPFVERARASSHYYDGASAPPSAVAGSTAKALEIVGRDPSLRQRLRENTRLLRAGLGELGLAVPAGETAHFGVAYRDAATMQAIHDKLRERRIELPYVGRIPGIPPTGVLRFAVNALHTPAQISQLLDELRPLL